MSEREEFDEWAKSNIENHCDAIFDGKYYIMRENSILTKEKKNFLILSLNMGLKAWKESVNRDGYKLVPTTPTPKVYDRLFAEHDLDEDRVTYIYKDIMDTLE